MCQDPVCCPECIHWEDYGSSFGICGNKVSANYNTYTLPITTCNQAWSGEKP